jgi:hypothetical protein
MLFETLLQVLRVSYVELPILLRSQNIYIMIFSHSISRGKNSTKEGKRQGKKTEDGGRKTEDRRQKLVLSPLWQIKIVLILC